MHSNYWSRGRVARQRSAKPRTAVRIRSRPLQKASPNRDAFFVSCPPIQEAKNRTRSASLISEKRFGDCKKKRQHCWRFYRYSVGQFYFLPSIFSFNSASASMSPKVDFSACAGISAAASSFFFAGAAAFFGALASSLNIAV